MTSKLNWNRPIHRLIDQIKREKRAGFDFGRFSQFLGSEPRYAASMLNKRKPTERKQKKSEERELIHQVGIAIIAHIGKHGDYTYAPKLVDATPKKTDKRALIEWLCQYGKLNYDRATKSFSYARDKSTDLEKAEQTPFWSFLEKSPKTPIAFDLRIDLSELILKARKRLISGSPNDEIDTALLRDLEALVATYSR